MIAVLGGCSGCTCNDPADCTRLPDSPAGRRVGWLLRRLAGGAEPLTRDELSDWCAPAAVEGVTVGQILRQVRDLSGRVGLPSLTGVQVLRDGLVLGILPGGGSAQRLIVGIEGAPPHRIARLDL